MKLLQQKLAEEQEGLARVRHQMKYTIARLEADLKGCNDELKECRQERNEMEMKLETMQEVSLVPSGEVLAILWWMELENYWQVHRKSRL